MIDIFNLDDIDLIELIDLLNEITIDELSKSLETIDVWATKHRSMLIRTFTHKLQGIDLSQHSIDQANEFIQEVYSDE